MLDRALRGLEKFLLRLGIGFAAILLPLLILVRVVEIITRNLNTPGSLYNAMESELFMLFAFLTIAAAAVNDSHVRVDVFRDRFSPRVKAVVEILGMVFFILPFSLVVLWYGSTLTGIVFSDGQRSAIAFGAPLRWLIIGAVPFGIGMFSLVALSKAIRNFLFLLGRAENPSALGAGRP